MGAAIANKIEEETRPHAPGLLVHLLAVTIRVWHGAGRVGKIMFGPQGAGR
jgi:hypothetical protein